MKLNCDLGESFGPWSMGADEQVMPHIDQASIATGFHAGEPLVIQRTLALAAQHGVTVGAHPAYPDLVGFGRRSMKCSAEEIIASLHYQISALQGMAACAGLQLQYVKPHGALYHDMTKDEQTRRAIFTALSQYRPGKPALIMQATSHREQHLAEAAEYGLTLWFEAFADRRYADDGALLSRQIEGAVLGREDILRQVSQLCEQGTVSTVGGKTLPLAADSLCIHGDNMAAVRAVRDIRALCG